MIYDSQQNQIYDKITRYGGYTTETGHGSESKELRHGATFQNQTLTPSNTYCYRLMKATQMQFTIFTLSAYVVLLLTNFVIAGITHHVKAITPLWLLVNTLNRIAAMCVLPAVLIDAVGFIF